MEKDAKKAFELAQQEVQEKSIENLKNIIKRLLEKLKDKQDKKNDLEEEIKLIKDDIEDFKKGRLDKIKERHDKDDRANDVSPIHITIINDNSRTIYPTQPWRWNYDVIWNYNPNYGGYTTTPLSSNNLTYLSASGTGLNYQAQATNAVYCAVSGSTAMNFTSGTYELGDGTIKKI